jgi:hypothetical protein
MEATSAMINEKVTSSWIKKCVVVTIASLLRYMRGNFLLDLRLSVTTMKRDAGERPQKREQGCRD